MIAASGRRSPRARDERPARRGRQPTVADRPDPGRARRGDVRPARPLASPSGWRRSSGSSPTSTARASSCATASCPARRSARASATASAPSARRRRADGSPRTPSTSSRSPTERGGSSRTSPTRRPGSATRCSTVRRCCGSPTRSSAPGRLGARCAVAHRLRRRAAPRARRQHDACRARASCCTPAASTTPATSSTRRSPGCSGTRSSSGPTSSSARARSGCAPLGGLDPIDVVYRRVEDDDTDPIEISNTGGPGCPACSWPWPTAASCWPTRTVPGVIEDPALRRLWPAAARGARPGRRSRLPPIGDAAHDDRARRDADVPRRRARLGVGRRAAPCDRRARRRHGRARRQRSGARAGRRSASPVGPPGQGRVGDRRLRDAAARSSRPLPQVDLAQSVPTRAADALFWAGRAAERAEAIARTLRVVAARRRQDPTLVVFDGGRWARAHDGRAARGPPGRRRARRRPTPHRGALCRSSTASSSPRDGARRAASGVRRRGGDGRRVPPVEHVADPQHASPR